MSCAAKAGAGAPGCTALSAPRACGSQFAAVKKSAPAATAPAILVAGLTIVFLLCIGRPHAEIVMRAAPGRHRQPKSMQKQLEEDRDLERQHETQHPFQQEHI